MSILLMEHDPRIDEPWKHFKDIDELEAYKAELARRLRSLWLPGKIPCDTGQGSADGVCAVIIKTDAPGAKCGCPENGRMSGAGRRSH